MDKGGLICTSLFQKKKKHYCGGLQFGRITWCCFLIPIKAIFAGFSQNMSSIPRASSIPQRCCVPPASSGVQHCRAQAVVQSWPFCRDALHVDFPRHSYKSPVLISTRVIGIVSVVFSVCFFIGALL